MPPADEPSTDDSVGGSQLDGSDPAPTDPAPTEPDGTESELAGSDDVPSVVRERTAVEMPPRWFEFLVATGTTGVLAYGLVALVLAMVAAYSLVPALIGGTVLWALSIWLLLRGLRPSEGARPGWNATTVAAGLAIVLAGGAFGWYGYAPSEHLLTDRDPAIYVNAAIWISHEGRLDAPDADDVFEVVDDVGHNSPGVYPTSDGLEFQFNHFTSALGAVAYDVAGPAGLFRFTGAVAAFGLLAVYAVAARALRRPFFALVVPIVVGIGLPLLVIARDVYSEPNLLLAAWTAAMLAASLWDRPRRSLASITGFVVGVLTVVRVESFLYVAAFASLAAFAAVLGGRAVRRVVPYAVLGVVPGVVVGLIDFYGFTGGYSSMDDGIGKQSLQAILFCAVVAVAAPLLLLLWRRFESIAGWVRRRRAGFAVVSGSLVTLFLGLLWLVRPLLGEDRSSSARWGVLARIQERDGQAVDVHRTYFEQSVNWVAWYLGPVTVALGIVGLGYMVARLLRGRLDPVLTVALALFSTGGLAYLILPNITPDQVWATRRLVPIVIVVIVLAAAVLIVRLVDLAPSVVGSPLRILAAGVLIVPVALTTAPLPLPTEQPAVFDAVEQVCDLIGDDAVVLVVDDMGQVILLPALRGVCGVPTGHLLRGVDDPDRSMDEARRRADELGVDLVLVSTEMRFLDEYESDAAGPVRSVEIPTNPREIERTLHGAPDRYMTGDDLFFVPRDLEVLVMPLEVGS